MSGADRLILDQLADGLRISDPRLASRLSAPHRPSRRRRRWGGAVGGVALMVVGLPLTLASPFWGGMLTVLGFVLLAAGVLWMSGGRL